jgi:hypothetical protein
MKDPERLLHEGDDFERELLGSLRREAPPEGAKGEAWRRIGAQIAAVTVIGGATERAAASQASGIATSLAKVSAAKLAIAIAGTALVLGGGAVVAHRRSANPPNEPVAVASPGLPNAPAAARVPEVTVPPVVVVSASPAATNRPASSSAAGAESKRLSAESALLTAARAALLDGNPRAAQASLAQMQAEFPHGVLSQEREVLAVEALAAEGKTEAAARHARAFIAAHPESPHSAQLRRLLQEP